MVAFYTVKRWLEPSGEARHDHDDRDLHGALHRHYTQIGSHPARDLFLTPGEAADCKTYDTLIELPEQAPDALLADKAYDTDAIRDSGITETMNFTGEPAPRAAKSSSMNPPFPPAAETWARTVVLSML